VGATFRVGHEIVAFPQVYLVSPSWYTYTGDAATTLSYQIELNGVSYRVWNGNNDDLFYVGPPESDGWSAVLPSPGFSQTDLTIPLTSRSFTFGLANDERFSIEGTFITGAGATAKTLKLGGLEGQRASQTGSNGEATTLRPVFSWIQVADKFIEDYYFDIIVNGNSVGKINFYYIIG
jgi:hypothetical protein